MKKITLHIGAEKTGSTSIQAFLGLNRDLLLKQGVFIPDFLTTGKDPNGQNHRKLPVIALNPDKKDDLFVLMELTDPHKRKSAIQKWKEEFLAAAMESTHPHWIVSSEHMQSRLTTIEEVRRLKSLLSGSFSEVEVLLYIRKPINAAASLWSTLIKGGNAISEFPLPDNWRVENNCNYKEIIERWQVVFNDAVKVRLFQKSSYHDGDLIKDFCHATGIQANESFDFPPTKNETLSGEAIRILSKLNKEIPMQKKKKLNPVRGNLNRFIIKHFSNFPKFLPAKEMTEAYASYYKDSDEWVRSKFFPDRKSLFEDDKDSAKKDGTEPLPQGMTEDALLAMIKDIWIQKNRAILNLKKKAPLP
jgi:hypothetical protein